MASDPWSKSSWAGSENQMVTQDKINPRSVVRAAASLLGTPYVENGRNRAGVDCVGLVIYIAKSLGMETPGKPISYRRSIRLAYALDQLKRYTVKIQTNRARPGMIIVMRPRHAMVHLGILDSMGTVISADNHPQIGQVARSTVLWSSVVATFGFTEVDY